MQLDNRDWVRGDEARKRCFFGSISRESNLGSRLELRGASVDDGFVRSDVA